MCDGAAINLTVLKSTHGYSGANNLNPGLSNEYQVRPGDKSILLLFSCIFLSGNSFVLTYYAQDFVWSFNILLKVKL